MKKGIVYLRNIKAGVLTEDMFRDVIRNILNILKKA